MWRNVVVRLTIGAISALVLFSNTAEGQQARTARPGRLTAGAGIEHGAGVQQARTTGPERVSLGTGIEFTTEQMHAIRAIDARTEAAVRQLMANAPGGRPSQEAVEALFIARAREIFRAVLTPAQREQWSANARALVAHA